VDLVPFGEYHGVPLGFRGVLEAPLSIDEAVRRVLPDGGPACHVIPAGPTLSRSAAVVSGGAAREVAQAIEAGAELYVTGESSHSVYHLAMESRINMIAAGHYATETWGVKAVAEAAARELGLETFFIDLPTGL
jgi:putative NIF3 family GTP cyclohydrolase 1 type 2